MKTVMNKLTIEDVKHVAKLANLPIDEEQLKIISEQLPEVIEFVDQLKEVDTASTTPTSQVTGLSDVLREDRVEADRMLTQEEALRNAPMSHSGFFVVPKIFE